jgi:hypothetical protein
MASATVRRLRRALAALGAGQGGQPAGRPGQPVFVDFTAAWCVTCQYNKKTTLANAAVLADLHAKKVHLLRADWTRRDPAITAALAQLGRNGVPVYVLYRPASRRWCCPNPERGRGALAIGRALTWGSVVPSLKWR